MRGIILAGGSGTRMYPVTYGVCKQLIPVHDKPLVYYPLSTLMLAGIKEIGIITTPHDQPRFQELLGDGTQLGCKFTYITQDQPRGLADAFIVGEHFIGKDKVCLILGDNIFYGWGFGTQLEKLTNPDGGIIFAYHVADPRRLGVVEFDENMKAVSIEEKPQNPKSSYGVPGLYFYDNEVIEIAKSLKPSARGEIEITDVNDAYLKAGKLKVSVIDRGVVWIDPGNFEDFSLASQFVEVIEKAQGLKIGCIEEVAWRQGFIDNAQLKKLAEPLIKSGYGQYLLKLLDE